MELSLFEVELCSNFKSNFQMPRLSERQKLLREVDMVAETLTVNGLHETKDFKEMLELKATLLAFRFLNLRKHLARSRTLNDALMHYSSNDFRQLARMDKTSSLRLLELIQADPIFQNRSRHKQAPVWMQLLVVMTRLGCYGNGASLGRIEFVTNFFIVFVMRQ